MTKLGTKWPNWVRNNQKENKRGYEMTKWYEITLVRNELGTKWLETIRLTAFWERPYAVSL